MNPSNDIQRREIFHFLFLEELLRVSDPRIYVLKGGVNLRFFFKSPRYSEDIDIDVLAGGVATLKKNGYKILESKAFRRSLESYGIADLALNDPSKAKQNETTQRFRLRLITDSGESLPTKVEFSRRSKEPLPEILEQIDPMIARQYNRRSYRVQHYTGETAAIQIKRLIPKGIIQDAARKRFSTLGILNGHFDAKPNREKKPRKIHHVKRGPWVASNSKPLRKR